VTAVITDPLAVLAALAVVVYVSLRLEVRVRMFRALGAALVGILFGMLLSNIGVLPGESPTYAFLVGPGLQVGIALILLGVNVRSIRDAGPTMLAAFALGAAGTAAGATVGALIFAPMVGPETWKLAGQFTGTYTGGGANFAAVGQALDTSSDIFTAALAADVSVTALWMATCLAVPVLLGRQAAEYAAPAHQPSPAGQPLTLERALYSSGTAISLSDAAALVLIAVGSVWLSGVIASWIPSIPAMLWLTTIVLAVAHIPSVQALPGGALWGNYLLLLFLASNGAQSVIANIVRLGPAVFYFAMTTVAIHGVVLFGMGRLLRLDWATLAVASQANVGGPASAMALAGARGYANQLLPGVAVGLLGYAVGNYLGLGVASLLHSLG